MENEFWPELKTGDMWVDDETDEIFAYDGSKLVPTKSEPQPSWEFTTDTDTTTMFEITPDHSVNIYNDQEILVSMDTLTGHVTFSENYTFDEASRIFYECLASANPLNEKVAKLERELAHYKQMDEINSNILDSLRVILEVPKFESITEHAANLMLKDKPEAVPQPSHPSWEFTDEGLLKGGANDTISFGLAGNQRMVLGEQDDIEYFRSHFSKAEERIPNDHPSLDKLKTQIECLEYIEKAQIECLEHIEKYQTTRKFDEAIKVVE